MIHVALCLANNENYQRNLEVPLLLQQLYERECNEPKMTAIFERAVRAVKKVAIALLQRARKCTRYSDKVSVESHWLIHHSEIQKGRCEACWTPLLSFH